MPIYIHEHQDNFTVVPNALIRDERLSPKDVGLLCYMLSLPQNWDFSVAGLDAVVQRYGRSAIVSSLQNLEKTGYVRKRRVRSNGRFTGFTWEITDTANVFPYSENPYMEKPYAEKPCVENPCVENRLQTKKQYNKETNKQRKECISHSFQIPDVQTVRAYCAAQNLKVDAKRFVDYYTSVGWKIGTKPMADWQAAVRNWDAQDRKDEKTGTSEFYAAWSGTNEV